MILLYGGLLAFCYFSTPKGPRPGPRVKLHQVLDMDKKQGKEFAGLIDKHRSIINGLDLEMSQVRAELYTLLASENHSLKDSLSHELSKLQQQVELAHFEHFLDLKGILRPDQLEKFNDLTEEISKLIGARPGPPPRRRK